METPVIKNPPRRAGTIVEPRLVATLLIPMKRPDAALGMMSVISAQSTARKVPAPRPTPTAPAMATSTRGASARTAIPIAPSRQESQIIRLRP